MAGQAQRAQVVQVAQAAALEDRADVVGVPRIALHTMVDLQAKCRLCQAGCCSAPPISQVMAPQGCKDEPEACSRPCRAPLGHAALILQAHGWHDADHRRGPGPSPAGTARHVASVRVTCAVPTALITALAGQRTRRSEMALCPRSPQAGARRSSSFLLRAFQSRLPRSTPLQPAALNARIMAG